MMWPSFRTGVCGGLVAFQCAIFADEVCLQVGDRIQDALSSIIELLLTTSVSHSFLFGMKDIQK